MSVCGLVGPVAWQLGDATHPVNLIAFYSLLKVIIVPEFTANSLTGSATESMSLHSSRVLLGTYLRPTCCWFVRSSRLRTSVSVVHPWASHFSAVAVLAPHTDSNSAITYKPACPNNKSRLLRLHYFLPVTANRR